MGEILIPEMLTATDALQMCRKVNGNMFVIKDNETRDKAFQLKLQHWDACVAGLWNFNKIVVQCIGYSHLMFGIQ